MTGTLPGCQCNREPHLSLRILAMLISSTALMAMAIMSHKSGSSRHLAIGNESIKFFAYVLKCVILPCHALPLISPRPLVAYLEVIHLTPAIGTAMRPVFELWN